MATTRPVEAVGDSLPVLRIESGLDNADSALRLANTILARWGDDTAWDAPTITIRHDLLTPAQSALVAALEPGDNVLTVGLPTAPGGTQKPNGLWKVEGYVEEWTRTDQGKLVYRTQLAVSDAHRWRTDPGQETRTAIQQVTPNPIRYPATPLSLRIDTLPADGKPPERPLESTYTISVDGEPVKTWYFSGTGPLTGDLGVQLDAGTHEITATYNGVWGFWLPSSATLTVTVERADPRLRLEMVPTGPIGASPVVTIWGDAHGAPARIEAAEEGAPDEWIDIMGCTVYSYIQFNALTRPRRFRVVFAGNSNFLPAVSNVVGFGYSWGMVKADHATWADVKASRATWAELESRA